MKNKVNASKKFYFLFGEYEITRESKVCLLLNKKFKKNEDKKDEISFEVWAATHYTIIDFMDKVMFLKGMFTNPLERHRETKQGHLIKISVNFDVYDEVIEKMRNRFKNSNLIEIKEFLDKEEKPVFKVKELVA